MQVYLKKNFASEAKQSRIAYKVGLKLQKVKTTHYPFLRDWIRVNRIINKNNYMGLKRIENIFKEKKDILSIYLTAGYPELNSMPELAVALADAGVDFLELGMPFSDPLADGETIQYSSSKALKNGMTLEKYFDQVAVLRQKVEVPLIFMGYFNQLLRYGLNRFLDKCIESGIDGLIIPDLPPDIYEKEYRRIFENYDLGLSFLITPTTPESRIKYLDNLSAGFVYAVSTSSTTGKENMFSDEQVEYFKRIKDPDLKNPVVIGFGISDRGKFLLANKYADGAIIGSAFIKALNSGGNYISITKNFVNKILGK